MQVINPLNMKVIGKSGVYKFTEHISQLYHVSVLACCKTRWWLDKGHHLRLLTPNGYILNKKLIIIHYLSMYLKIPWPTTPEEANPSHRENISLSAWFFTKLFVVCSEQKPATLLQTQETEGDTIWGAEWDMTRPELGSHSTVWQRHNCLANMINYLPSLCSMFLKRTIPDDKYVLFLSLFMHIHK